jgi:hypothetical protein
MLRFFSPLKTEETAQYLTQQANDAKDKIQEVQAMRIKTESAKRPVGRPKKVPTLPVSLAPAPVTPTTETGTTAQTDAVGDVNPTSGAVVSGAKKRRRPYLDWFGSAFIHDILHAYSMMGSGYSTVQYLRRKYPKLPTESIGRFDNLSESTVDSWFDVNPTTNKRQLKEQYASLLGDQRPIHAGGRPRILDRYPKMEEELKDRLLEMRKKSNIGVAEIRAVMHAFIKRDHPELFQEISLSKSFVSHWARCTLKWSIRRGTTSQSKLPKHWEDEGKTMMKRLAILIKQEKIKSRTLVINFDQTAVHLVPSGRSKKQTQFSGYFINTQQMLDTDDEIELINKTG